MDDDHGEVEKRSGVLPKWLNLTSEEAKGSVAALTITIDFLSFIAEPAPVIADYPSFDVLLQLISFFNSPTWKSEEVLQVVEERGFFLVKSIIQLAANTCILPLIIDANYCL